MSSFRCEVCGVDCIDTPRGYVTGCEHYPLFKKEDNEAQDAGSLQGLPSPARLDVVLPLRKEGSESSGALQKHGIQGRRGLTE